MAWLTKAVAAGYTDVHKINTDADLESLRGREDFKKLSADPGASSQPPTDRAAPPRPAK